MSAAPVRIWSAPAPRAVLLYEDEVETSCRLLPGPWGVEVPLPFEPEDSDTPGWPPATVHPGDATGDAPGDGDAADKGAGDTAPEAEWLGRAWLGSKNPSDTAPEDGASEAAIDPPTAARIAGALLVGLLEVAQDRRPLRQLEGRLSGDAVAQVGQLRVLASQERGPLVLRTVRVDRPNAGVLEVAGVVACGSRRRAVAARLEHRRHLWVCTSLAVV